MSGKHTPGPWEASFSFPGRDGIGDVWQIDADSHAVCTTQFCYAPNTEANARLIAAAPDLLEAVQKLKMAFGDPMTRRALGGHNEAQMTATLAAAAAIARATGDA